MATKEFTRLSLLMPVAMSLGTLMSIELYNTSQKNLAIIPIIGSAVLIAIIFYTYKRRRNIQKKK